MVLSGSAEAQQKAKEMIESLVSDNSAYGSGKMLLLQHPLKLFSLLSASHGLEGHRDPG